MNKVLDICRKEYFLFLLAAITSLFLSFWSNWQESIVNPDGICYLLSAESISQSGLRAAFQTCHQARWGFYSILIYAFTQLSTLSYQLSAYTIDAFFTLISVLTFIAIVKELGGGKRVLWLAAMVILLSHEFNSVRQYIVRDHGFWTFYLLSVFCLLRFIQLKNIPSIFGFHLSLLLATLFRVESLIFLVFIPFVMWILPGFSLRARFQNFLLFYTPFLLIVACILIYILLTHHLPNMGRIAEVVYQFKHGFIVTFEKLHTIKSNLAQYILMYDSVRDAGWFLFSAMTIWYVLYVILNVSWAYTFLILYACYYRLFKFKTHSLYVLSAYIIVNMGITFIFFAQHFFLSKRYLVALSLILMLFVPFAIDALLSRWQDRSKRYFLFFSLLLVVISAIGGIINFGYSKEYIREAGTWIHQHVPRQASLYINDPQLMYYSDHFGLDLFNKLPLYLEKNVLANRKWQQYDYLALRLPKHDAEKVMIDKTFIHVKPEEVFMNSRGDRVVIYKTIAIKQQEKIS